MIYMIVLDVLVSLQNLICILVIIKSLFALVMNIKTAFYISLWHLWIPRHAFWTHECTCDLSNGYEHFCFRHWLWWFRYCLSWWYSCVLWNWRWTHDSCWCSFSIVYVITNGIVKLKKCDFAAISVEYLGSYCGLMVVLPSILIKWKAVIDWKNSIS